MQTDPTTTRPSGRRRGRTRPRIGTRLRRTAYRAALGGTAAALAIAAPAAAAQPSVLVETTDAEMQIPAEENPCGVTVTFEEVSTKRTTTFVDTDGTVVRQQVHGIVTTTVTSEYGQSINRWGANVVIDFTDGTYTRAGNYDNVHAGAGGVIVNGSGRIVVDETTGDVLFTAGPLELIDANWDEFCAPLTP
jgi:hypothetical protein